MDKHDMRQVAAVLSCQAAGEVKGFAYDSRSVERGDLFFALPGATYDGHQFLKEVAAKGAVGSVVSKDYQGPNFGLQLLRVDQVIEALHKLAQAVQQSRPSRVIGVTGSVGKTTTKEF